MSATPGKEWLETLRARISSVDPAEAARRARDGAWLVDVREQAEHQAGSAMGARNVPKGYLEVWAERLLPDRDQPLLVMCQTGVRSLFAVERCQTYLGMPGAYEAGFERLNWFTQLLMSWMGDHGLMRAMSAQFRAFHWQGDAVRLFATVTDKRVEDGEHLVDLRIWSESHPRGERTTEGEATVQLPSRG